jgi:putative colanic acid biosynthesis acetyltransferase WcaF
MILQGNDPTTQPSFSLRNRIGRALWHTTWLLLFRPSPRPLHAWRAALLRLFGAKLGVDAHVYPAARIWAPWNLEVGHHVGIADGVTLYSMARIVVGDYSVISQGAHLCCGSHDYNSPTFQLFAKPITLGAHVWVCAEAFLSPGVTVAEGCVIGARSMVTRSLDSPWTVYAGNPCQTTGKRRQNQRRNALHATP